jgi:hypothetical protein
MPLAPTNIGDREEVLPIVVDPAHVLRLQSNWLKSSYFGVDKFNEIRVNPGLIVALDGNTGTNQYKYVPYSSSASYGPSSSTAVGILEVIQFETYDEVAISPVVHGKVIEAHCYVYGAAAKGSIPAAVKTALKNIIWV